MMKSWDQESTHILRLVRERLLHEFQGRYPILCPPFHLCDLQLSLGGKMFESVVCYVYKT